MKCSLRERCRRGLRFRNDVVIVKPLAERGVRDAEIAAHAAFRKRLYDHDVVPEAQAAATALT